MDLELHNKVVLITGGAKGIGAAIARGVFEEGARPVIGDHDAVAGQKLARELSRAQTASCFIPVELTSVQSCASLIEQTIAACGGLDAVVNNAGVNDRVGLEEGNPEAYLASLERNLLHYYNVTHYAVPHLKSSHGAVVNIASKTAITGQGGTSGYASAKGAILALTREWAVELLAYGIRVNAVVPAEVMTPLYRQWLATFPQPDTKLRTIVSKIPLGNRMTTAEEIAAMAVFLLSSKAAGHVTGQQLFVDGGYVHLDRAIT